MARVAHKYMPAQMPVEELRSTFASRHHTLDYLVKALRDQAGARTLTSYLITGPRGAGKTTLLLMLALRLREEVDLRASWLPVRFPEELPAVTSLRDLLAGALQALAEDGLTAAREWHVHVEREADEKRSRDLAVAGLRSIAAAEGRRLILLVENLDAVFERGLDAASQATLRRLLMTEPFMLIVGTAVQVFEELRRYDKAFFNYFCPVPLEPLDDEQIHALLAARARHDGNDTFEERYRRARPKIQSITRLSGGNPRLVLMLYEVLSEGDLGSVVDTLRELVDELTPILKDVVEHQLAGQQAKILDALMRAGGTATPADLARAARLSLNIVTTQLRRLKNAQVVELRGGGKGRPAYYSVADQLFLTWYQMRYLRPQRRRVEMFVEVLRLWFEAEERLRALRAAAARSAAPAAGDRFGAAVKAEYLAASLIGSEYSPSAETLSIRSWIQAGSLREAALALAELRQAELVDQGAFEVEAYLGLSEWSHEHGDPATEVAALAAAADAAPGDAELRASLGMALSNTGNIAGAMTAFDDALMHAKAPLVRARVLYTRAAAKFVVNDFPGAVADCTAVVELAQAPPELIARAVFRRGVAKEQQGSAVQASTDYTAVVELVGAPAILVADSLVRRGAISEQQGDTPAALADFATVVGLPGAHAEQVAEALVHRGVIRERQGDVAAAFADFATVVDLAGARANQIAKALIARGITRTKQHDLAGAVADFTAVVKLAGVPADHVAVATSARGVIRLLQASRRPESRPEALEDLSAAVSTAGVCEPIRNRAARLALEFAWRDEIALAAILKGYRVGSALLEPSARVAHITGLLTGLASPARRQCWLTVWRTIAESESPEVIEPLRFLTAVADILEQPDDLSPLDPLAPEHRAFAQEVLRRFDVPRATPSG